MKKETTVRKPAVGRVTLQAKRDYVAAMTRRVKVARESAKLTQEQLAKRIRVPQNHYKHWEVSRAVPHYFIEAFCAATGVSIEWLITGRDRLRDYPVVMQSPVTNQ